MSVAETIREMERMFGSPVDTKVDTKKGPEYSVKNAISEIERIAFGRKSLIDEAVDYKNSITVAYNEGIINFDELRLIDGRIERIKRVIRREDKELGKPKMNSFRDYLVNLCQIL